MNIRYLYILFILLNLFNSGCPPQHKGCSDARCGNAIGDLVDPAITAINGALDDQIDSLFASTSGSRYAGILRESRKLISVKEAWAAMCARPSTAPCVNEIRTAEYSACEIDTTPFALNGTVTMAYIGTPNCGFTDVGDTVTRIMNVSRTIPDNGLVTTFNKNLVDPGIPGGGTKLTITGANQHDLEILGIHKSVNNNANVRRSREMDLRTTAPIKISGGLARGVRSVTGGSLDITFDNHTVTFSPSNLGYIAECCYPISGTMNFFEFAGTEKIPRSAIISFPKCGTATITTPGGESFDGNVYDISLVACE